MAESLRETERDLFGVYSDEIQGALCIRLVEERLLDLFKEGKLGRLTCFGPLRVRLFVWLKRLPG